LTAIAQQRQYLSDLAVVKPDVIIHGDDKLIPSVKPDKDLPKAVLPKLLENGLKVLELLHPMREYLNSVINNLSEFLFTIQERFVTKLREQGRLNAHQKNSVLIDIARQFQARFDALPVD